jgi:AraC family transcriptional regulator, transcriptional activator of pobA
MQKIKHYDGLYGDLNFKHRNDYIFFEMIETRSVGFDWVINEHIHSHLYQFFFIESGNVEFKGSEKSKKLTTPCILIIPPNTLHGLKYSADVKGNILTISDMIMENVCRELPSVLVNLEGFHYLSFRNKKELVYKKIVSMLADINGELFTDRPEKKGYLHACFLQLFIYLVRLFQTNEITTVDDTNTTFKHFRTFQLLVKKSETLRSIPSFAKETGISTVHLNRICKQVAGKSALIFLQEQRIEQAKNYLIHTSYSISEIAYHLNFEYPNYFARLFKKITGVTPTAFRNKKRG